MRAVLRHAARWQTSAHTERTQAQLDSAADIIGEVEFEERCDGLEQRFYALEDDLRSLMLAYVRANGLV